MPQYQPREHVRQVRLAKGLSSVVSKVPHSVDGRGSIKPTHVDAPQSNDKLALYAGSTASDYCCNDFDYDYTGGY